MDPDPDPAIFFLDLQDANKKLFSLAFQFFFFCFFKALPAHPAQHQGLLHQYILTPSVADLNPMRIRMFLGLPDPDPLVRDVNVPSKSNKQKNFDFC